MFGVQFRKQNHMFMYDVELVSEYEVRRVRSSTSQSSVSLKFGKFGKFGFDPTLILTSFYPISKNLLLITEKSNQNFLNL